MNKTEKMTNVKALTYVKENCEMPADVAEKIDNILATYAKKSASNGERKPTEAQKANAATAEKVAEWLNTHKGESLTAGEIFKRCEACATLPSVQKLTPMLTKLVEANLVAKSVVKGRTYYSVME